MESPRITLPTLLVLKSLLGQESIDSTICGYDLALSSGVSQGSIYPILYRLERAGWVVSSINPYASRKKTVLRFYQLTEEGKKNILSLLETIHSE